MNAIIFGSVLIRLMVLLVLDEVNSDEQMSQAISFQRVGRGCEFSTRVYGSEAGKFLTVHEKNIFDPQL